MPFLQPRTVPKAWDSAQNPPLADPRTASGHKHINTPWHPCVGGGKPGAVGWGVEARVRAARNGQKEGQQGRDVEATPQRGAEQASFLIPPVPPTQPGTESRRALTDKKKLKNLATQSGKISSWPIIQLQTLSLDFW